MSRRDHPPLVQRYSLFLIKRLLLCLMTIILTPVVCDARLAKHGCNDTCGGISIPYPFGVGPNCSYNSWFDIACKTTSDHPQKVPFLTKLDVVVFNISVSYDYPWVWGEVIAVGMMPFNVCSAATPTSNAKTFSSHDLRSSPFSFSIDDNEFVLRGCPGSAVFTNKSGDMLTACTIDVRNSKGKNCSAGFTSCSLLDLYATAYKLEFFQGVLQLFQGDDDDDASGGGTGGDNCLFATLLRTEYLNEFVQGGLSYSSSPAPTILDWSFPDTKYVIDEKSHPQADCYEEYNTCRCKNGYKGNPYLSNGCEAIKEYNNRHGECVSNSGSYYYSKSVEQLLEIISVLIDYGKWIVIIRGGFLFLFLCCFWSFRSIKKRSDVKRKAKNFERNGGLLLQQHLSTNKGALEKSKIFTTTELGTATDPFNEDQVLGQGGQGTVYKGVLTDGRLVAIKKSKQHDKSQLENFINEVLIVSQINHRNVVKLLGCCVETEVPLLIYEFISNGTLYQHIHDTNKDSCLTWEMRLGIASESAGAIAYLHSSLSPPIYHRDIKSVNILLDQNNKAKVSDFGCSKTIAINQTHLTTHVRGTFGYLDPEYFRSNQFTEKSDVYSFGVVLVELLTSKKPIFKDKEESSNLIPKSLAEVFLFMMENGRVVEFLDPLVAFEAKEEEIFAVAELAKQCLSSSGRMRPTMREVAIVLDTIIEAPNSNVRIPTLESSSSEEGSVDDLITSEVDLESIQAKSVSFHYVAGRSSTIASHPFLYSSTLCDRVPLSILHEN